MRRCSRLIDKGSGYTLHDRRELLEIIRDLLEGLVPRYARLAERGQVELSVTPYAHPILPLLMDLDCAHETLPDVPLPRDSTIPAARRGPTGISAKASRCSATTSASPRRAAGRRRAVWSQATPAVRRR